MNDFYEPYETAAELSATNEERSGLWEVHGLYEERPLDNGDRVAVAKPLERADLDPEEINAVEKRLGERKRRQRELGLDDRVASGRFYGTTRYSPLRDRPGLFLRFSRLADSGGVSPGQWFEWVAENGVLGKTAGSRGDRGIDAYSVFQEEARLASRTRRLFEAATRPRKPDVAGIQELLPAEYEGVNEDPRHVEKVALGFVAETVQREVRQGCFYRILPRDNFRQSRRSPLLRQWGFHSLLGAMWLQFEWLVSWDKWMRRCKNCWRMLSPERTVRAEYCGKLEGAGKACKQDAKRKRERES